MRKALALALTFIVGLSGYPVAVVSTTVVAAAAATHLLTASSEAPVVADAEDEFPQGPDGVRNARRLGGRTSFQRPALTDLKSLQQLMARPGIPADVRKVLDDAGLTGESGPAGALADTVVNAMTAWPTDTGSLGSCDSVRPAEGVIAECEFHKGSMMKWMSLRPGAPKDRTPGIIHNVRWAGDKPFRAFIFRVAAGANKIYTFVVPKDCGNLALLDVADVPPAPAPAPPPQAAPVVPPPAPQAPVPAPVTQSLECFAKDAAGKPMAGVTVRARDANGQIVATAVTDDNGQCAFGVLPPGNYTVEAVSAAGAIIAVSAPVAVAAGVSGTAVVTGASAVSAIAVAGGTAGLLGFLTSTTGVLVLTGAVVAGVVTIQATQGDASPSR